MWGCLFAYVVEQGNKTKKKKTGPMWKKVCLLALKKRCKSERGSEFKGTDLASAYERTQYQNTAESEGLAGTSPKDIHRHTQINAKQKIVNVTFYFFVLISFISVEGSYCPAQSGSN